MSVRTDSILVLHVDDEPGLADVAAEFLEREDERIEVVTATRAGEGLERLAERDVDCVVSDYDMPEQDGLEFLDAIRAEYGDLPFVLFTGKGSETIASEAISRGVTDYLQKRTDPDQYTLLANRVTNAVERRRSRDALAERKRRLETLISNLPGMIYRCRNEPGWPMEFVGGECEDLTGYPASALENDEVLWGEEVLHPEDRDWLWDAVQVALEEREPFEVTYRILDADGNLKWAWERGRGIYEGGELVALEGFITDITERVERERELEATKERLELALDAANLGVWDRDLRSGDLDVDRRWTEMLGYSPEEFDPDVETWRSLVHPEDLSRVQSTLSGHLEGDRDRYHSEYRLRTSDGGYRWVRSVGTVVERDREGDPTRMVGIHQDVDEKKQRRRELERQNERLEEFASIVSHDLRNPLGVAQGGLELARNECDSDHLDTVAEGHDRMATLIDDLLALARHGDEATELERVSLATVVEECWVGVDAAEADLVVETNRVVRADPGGLRQLLANLLANAVEHGSRDDGDGAVTVRVGGLPGGFYVEDDGPGIPPENRETVFETGYSTSRDGTGFGLSVVTRVAEAHGWDVAVTESDSGGARFEFTGVEPDDA